MKFQSYRFQLGQWRDLDSGKTLDGVVGLVADQVIDAPSVQVAMHMLRSYRNPSPILSVVDDAGLWARAAVRRLVQ